VVLLDDDVPWVNDGTRVFGDQRAPFEQRFHKAAVVVENVVRRPMQPRFDPGVPNDC
jgi:nicotinamide riboside kinase